MAVSAAAADQDAATLGAHSCLSSVGSVRKTALGAVAECTEHDAVAMPVGQVPGGSGIDQAGQPGPESLG